MLFLPLLKKSVIIVLAIIGLYSLYQYFEGQWTATEALDFIYDFILYRVIPGIIIAYIAYKTIIEKILLYLNRKKSAEVLATRIPKIIQKSGSVRAGKDSSTTSAALLVKEYVLTEEIKEMQELRKRLFIYDFKRVDLWLNVNGKIFLVSGKKRINEAYASMLRKNQCFIHTTLLRKIDPKVHYHSWRKYKGTRVLDYSFKDGLTPGGIPFLSLLQSYVIMYVQHIFIPNFIMSNQPIMEKFKINKKHIEKLMSKKFSQDYIKLKENTPIPLPLRGFIIETETAIFYSNTNRGNESEDKSTNGIREFFTTAGHTLQERVFYYGITQSATRTSKSIRELYQGYQHVFKSKVRATSGYRRFMLSVVIALIRAIEPVVNLLDFLYTKHLIQLLHKKRGISLKTLNQNNPFRRFKTFLLMLISKIKARQKRLYNRGYIEFYIGVYENLSDVGKRVPFPKIGVLLESKTTNNTYIAYGFKQTVKIKDTWGRYDTHYMKFIREEKEKVHSMHFNDVPNWDHQFQISHQDAEFTGYKVFRDILKFVYDRLEEERKEKKRSELKFKQSITTPIDTPDFTQLEINEVIALANDFGIDLEKLSEINFEEEEERIYQALVTEYKKFRKR